MMGDFSGYICEDHIAMDIVKWQWTKTTTHISTQKQEFMSTCPVTAEA